MKAMWSLLLLACALPAAAQTTSCPQADDVVQAHLLGTWRAEVEGLGPATLRLEKHAEFAESVSGSLERAGRRSQVAGDVDNGELTLEESADGVHIAATWLGDVVEGSCGREIRGTWTLDGQQSGSPFVLRKQ
jgi:hypothetical protein